MSLDSASLKADRIKQLLDEIEGFLETENPNLMRLIFMYGLLKKAFLIAIGFVIGCLW